MRGKNIELINCNQELIKILLKGDEHLSNELKINIPQNWSEFGREIFEFSLKLLKADPSQAKWLSYLPIEIKSKTLIGTCGYKGNPSSEGMVEIGYEVAKNFRNQGYATEISELLISNAFKNDQVYLIQAHTLAEKNASVRVLQKCGFKFIEEYEDSEDGLVGKWQLSRVAFGQIEELSIS